MLKPPLLDSLTKTSKPGTYKKVPDDATVDTIKDDHGFIRGYDFEDINFVRFFKGGVTAKECRTSNNAKE